MSRKRRIVFLCAIAVMVIAGCVAVATLVIPMINNRVYEDLPEKVVVSASETPTPTQTPAEESSKPTGEPSPTPEATAEPYVSPVNFDELWDINEDIYAWISIPGMDIAYPIAQHPTDDSYYLNHTIEGNSGLPASIYTEASANKKDFTDFNTVIYGHNAGEGRMFSNLLNYRDEAVLDENREIVIYTPEAEYHYTIFAAVLFGDEYLPYYYPGNTEENRQAYLDALKNVRDLNSHVLDDIEVTADSKLITLSTCPDRYRQDPQRFLVVAVLNETGEQDG